MEMRLLLKLTLLLWMFWQIYIMLHVFQLSDSFNGGYYCYCHLCCCTGGLVRIKALLCKVLYKYLAVTEVPGKKGIHWCDYNPHVAHWSSICSTVFCTNHRSSRKILLQANSGVHVQILVKRGKMSLQANPDTCSPVRKAAHSHGNAHKSKKLLWGKSTRLSPWVIELLCKTAVRKADWFLFSNVLSV